MQEKIEKFRGTFISEIEELIWRKEVNAAYDESKVSAVEGERLKGLEKVAELTKQLEGFDASDKSKQTRDAKKKLQQEIDKENINIDAAEELLNTMHKAIKTARNEVANLSARVEFAKNYGKV
jgi:chromosome segregation ATPase